MCGPGGPSPSLAALAAQVLAARSKGLGTLRLVFVEAEALALPRLRKSLERFSRFAQVQVGVVHALPNTSVRGLLARASGNSFASGLSIGASLIS